MRTVSMRRYSATPEPVPLVEDVGDDPASAVDSAPAGDTPADLPMPPDLDGVPDLKPLPGHEGVRLKKLAWGKQRAQNNMVSPIRLASSRRSSRSAPVAAPWPDPLNTSRSQQSTQSRVRSMNTYRAKLGTLMRTGTAQNLVRGDETPNSTPRTRPHSRSFRVSTPESADGTHFSRMSPVEQRTLKRVRSDRDVRTNTFFSNSTHLRPFSSRTNSHVDVEARKAVTLGMLLSEYIQDSPPNPATRLASSRGSQVRLEKSPHRRRPTIAEKRRPITAPCTTRPSVHAACKSVNIKQPPLGLSQFEKSTLRPYSAELSARATNEFRSTKGPMLLRRRDPKHIAGVMCGTSKGYRRVSKMLVSRKCKAERMRATGGRQRSPPHKRRPDFAVRIGVTHVAPRHKLTGTYSYLHEAVGHQASDRQRPRPPTAP